MYIDVVSSMVPFYCVDDVAILEIMQLTPPLGIALVVVAIVAL